jgi:plastocyanin
VIGGLATSGVLGVLTAGLATVAGPAPAAAADVTITMQNFPNPQFCVNGDCANHSVTITEGQTVTWNYQDTGCDVVVACPGHTASYPGSTPEKFESGQLRGSTVPFFQPGPYATSFTFTFTRPGTYSYFCAYHGKDQTSGVLNMNGVVVVKPAPNVSSSGATPGEPTQVGSPSSTTADFSDLLPNTYVPGLPSAGAQAASTEQDDALPLILAAIALMATVTATLVAWLRPVAQPARR